MNSPQVLLKGEQIIRRLTAAAPNRRRVDELETLYRPFVNDRVDRPLAHDRIPALHVKTIANGSGGNLDCFDYLSHRAGPMEYSGAHRLTWYTYHTDFHRPRR